jgi:rhamnogalacturonyl hydrolase YesR
MIPMRNLLLFSGLVLAVSAAHAQTDAKFITAVVAKDGSYRYYMSERVVNNDPKGIGPAIMAGLQVSYRYYMSERVVNNEPKGIGPAIMAGLQVSELSS